MKVPPGFSSIRAPGTRFEAYMTVLRKMWFIMTIHAAGTCQIENDQADKVLKELITRITDDS
jgi:hypothetical protein